MKTYVTKLNIKAGEYEKSCTKLVHANSEEEAKKVALLGECHGDIGEHSEWTENGIADLGWEFHYSIHSCQEVADEHLAIVKSYI